MRNIWFVAQLLLGFLLLEAAGAEARVVDAVAIMRQPADEHMCVLSFDDGPGPYTAQLLDSLQEEGVPATFFVLGQNVRRHPDLIRRMMAEGHEIGSHSYSHPNLRRLGAEAQRAELEKTDALLRELGVEPHFFRPPYGNFTPTTAALAEELGMSVVTWSSDSRDWKRRPTDYQRQMINSTGHSVPGAMRGVFLFHDIRKATVEDLSRIVSDLRAGGCQRFVTLSEYMRDRSEDAPILARQQDPAPAIPAAAPGDPAPALHVGDAPDPSTTPAADAPAAAPGDATAPPSEVPLARSASPWFWPGLFRSGT